MSHTQPLPLSLSWRQRLIAWATHRSLSTQISTVFALKHYTHTPVRCFCSRQVSSLNFWHRCASPLSVRPDDNIIKCHNFICANIHEIYTKLSHHSTPTTTATTIATNYNQHSYWNNNNNNNESCLKCLPYLAFNGTGRAVHLWLPSSIWLRCCWGFYVASGMSKELVNVVF